MVKIIFSSGKMSGQGFLEAIFKCIKDTKVIWGRMDSHRLNHARQTWIAFHSEITRLMNEGRA